MIKLSLVIPCRDVNDPKLKELLRSIDEQDFPKEELETLVITEGTSESAKAIGIRKAKGEVIGILASDNELIGKHYLYLMSQYAESYGAAYSAFYAYSKKDNILNRYFSLIGGNDTLSFYMVKNDRSSYLGSPNPNGRGSIGDNGFFVKDDLIKSTDLENYYHVDNALEAVEEACGVGGVYTWHKTGGNIFSFFAKRYRYGLQHAFNKNRRWHLVDFRQPKDVMRLLWFIICTITLIQPLLLSLRGYLRIRDVAWFLHPLVCLGTLFTYGVLIIHLALNRMFQSLFAPMAVRRA